MEDNVAFLSSDSNRDVYLWFIKHQVIKVTEIVRVRKSLHGMSTAGKQCECEWWTPLHLRVKHHDKRFQREIRREFPSACDQDIWIGSEVCGRILIRLLFSTASFASRNHTSSVWSYNKWQKWLTRFSKNARFYRQFHTYSVKTLYIPLPWINVVCRWRQIRGFKTQQ